MSAARDSRVGKQSLMVLLTMESSRQREGVKVEDQALLTRTAFVRWVVVSWLVMMSRISWGRDAMEVIFES